MLRKMCADEGLAVKSCGKVVVARDELEVQRLHDLHSRAIANGVDVQLVDVNELRRLEPLATTHEVGLWSPNTGVADPAEVTRMVARVFQRQGGEIRFQSKVDQVDGSDVVLTDGRRITGRHVVNAAGLYADSIAHGCGVGHNYSILPFKGLYLYGDETAPALRRHVYPVPDPRNPFLGVHLTVTIHGRVKVGPTAIPALSRLNYSKFGGIKRDELLAMFSTLPKFLTSPHHDGLGLIRSEVPKYLRRTLIRQASSLVPTTSQSGFREWGKSGIRAQLFNLKERKLEMDFVVEEAPFQTHVLNAVSPAWTSSLSFGDYIAESVTRSLG